MVLINHLDNCLFHKTGQTIHCIALIYIRNVYVKYCHFGPIHVNDKLQFFNIQDQYIIINPYPAEFLKWNNLPSLFGTIHHHF